MSKEAYLKFLDRAAQDDALQRELAANATGTPAAISAEVLARIATQRGFSVTIDDVRAHTLELGEDALQQVAGGLAGARPAPSAIFTEKWISFMPLRNVLGAGKV